MDATAINVFVFVIGIVGGVIGLIYWATRPVDETESSSVWDDTDVTPAPSRSPTAVTSEPSRSTIPGAQRIDTTPMTDRQLWEQIEYNTRMSADVLHRMWTLVVIIVFLNVIAAIAMVAFQ